MRPLLLNFSKRQLSNNLIFKRLIDEPNLDQAVPKYANFLLKNMYFPGGEPIFTLENFRQSIDRKELYREKLRWVEKQLISRPYGIVFLVNDVANNSGDVSVDDMILAASFHRSDGPFDYEEMYDVWSGAPVNRKLNVDMELFELQSKNLEIVNKINERRSEDLRMIYRLVLSANW